VPGTDVWPATHGPWLSHVPQADQADTAQSTGRTGHVKVHDPGGCVRFVKHIYGAASDGHGIGVLANGMVEWDPTCLLVRKGGARGAAVGCGGHDGAGSGVCAADLGPGAGAGVGRRA
jgi:hypothetical protein